ncbi:carbon-nitrogen hydrolase family protein [Nocardia sp. NPDC088792]|uniref:carbon-nitrogen hydrolase family protein n=1 Tax=Nocardia sp. NPDC088792 TaxID=3364332 RepID=UPI0037FA8066
MRIAAAQLTCVPADVQANVRQVVALADRAREEGARLVVFPELALTGYELEAIAGDSGLWVDAEDSRLDALRGAGIGTVVNCAGPGEHGGGPRIVTYVYGADGALVTTYYKQRLYEQEQRYFTAGEVDGRFELDGVRFALATCFDNHFPDLIARVREDHCDIHLASSLYGTGGGIDERAKVYPGIAADANVFVALANHVGAAGSFTGCGGAALWAPGGVLLTEADDHTAMVAVADIAV